MTITKHLLALTLMTGSLAMQSSVDAQEKSKPAKPPKLFEDNSEMQVTLSGPWREIKNNIKKDALYPVQFTFTGADGQQHSFKAEVSPRGITRRLRVCDFPPLKVHFDKKAMKGTEFRGNKTLKLVTYCDTNSKYEQYYVKEFLTYRIFNLLTDYSFRVRPMTIEYVDSERDGNPITRFSFFIEDIDDVAKRNDMEKLNLASIPYRELEPATTNIMSLFQFMIGNLDWAATSGPKEDGCCHNSRLIGTGNDAVPKFGIPYDFDSSGLVNAHYAAPPNQLKLRNIRQRLYRGFCSNNDQLGQSAALFNEKKPDILALFEQNKHLNDRTVKDAVRYLEEFYEILNDPKKLDRYIIGKCRGKG